MKYRQDIQLLRGVAVLAVLAFHLSEKFVPYGYLGVDVFFVISGFVLTNSFTRIFQGSKHSYYSKLVQFYRFRFWRLTPALLVMISGSALMIFLLGPPSSHYSFSLQGIATIFLIGNFSAVKLNGDYFRPDPNPLLHTWSLSLEEQIYIFLPVLLVCIFLFLRFTLKKFFYIVIFLTTISLIVNLNPSMAYPLYSIVVSEQDLSIFSFYSPIERFYQFGIGILTKAFEIKINKTSFFRSCVFIFFILSWFVGIYNLDLEILTCLITSQIILRKILLHDYSKILEFFIWVGNRSYSIYLVHLPVIWVAKFSPIMSSDKSIRRLLLLCAFAFSIFLGSLLYSVIEQRFRLSSNLLVYELKPMLKKSRLIFLLCPLLLFSMLGLVSTNYLGLIKIPPTPLAEYELNHECNITSAKQKLCKITNLEGAQVVMLLGDSHAAHLKLTFLEAARANNLNAVISTNIGCKFYLDELSELSSNDDCLVENLRNFSYIKNNKVDYVIISQRVLSDSPLSTLSKAIIELRKHVKSVGILSNTPEFPNNPFDVPMINHIIDLSESLQNSFELNKLPSENKKASDDLVAMLGERVKTLDLFSLYCDARECSRVRDAKYLYVDENHLSVAGAQLALPKLSLFIAELTLD